MIRLPLYFEAILHSSPFKQMMSRFHYWSRTTLETVIADIGYRASSSGGPICGASGWVENRTSYEVELLQTATRQLLPLVSAAKDSARQYYEYGRLPRGAFDIAAPRFKVGVPTRESVALPHAPNPGTTTQLGRLAPSFAVLII